ncbi:hypothetical protein NL676_037121 [Syzygium grande]|nr:hypothetical protein NL676_037121 [Syzygium grande]
MNGRSKFLTLIPFGKFSRATLSGIIGFPQWAGSARLIDSSDKLSGLIDVDAALHSGAGRCPVPPRHQEGTCRPWREAKLLELHRRRHHQRLCHLRLRRRDMLGGNNSRVFSLQLENLKLSGPIPESLQLCRSLQTLNLAGNNISGTIPPRICGWLPYLVSLDLSSNGLEGSLPSELANCKFLNNLELSDNKLSGTIPPELAKLQRLKTFSIAGNDLNGEIPPSFAGFNAAGFSGNRGLCGTPLGRCGGGQKKMAVIVGAGVSGAVASLAVSFGLLWWCERRSIRLTRGGTGTGRGTKVDAQR